VSEQVVIVDGENVRRSTWPNIGQAELVERCRAWAERQHVSVEVVFDGKRPPAVTSPEVAVFGSEPESADSWIARRAAELRADGAHFWLVTSDRALRADAGRGAERVIGGGSFARELGPQPHP
jgi:predicted RNA-binding protein with PIN domain